MTIDAHELFCRQQQAKPTKPHEARCPECRARISKSPTRDVEYGHYKGCSRRPEEFPEASATVVRGQGDHIQEVLDDAV